MGGPIHFVPLRDARPTSVTADARLASLLPADTRDIWADRDADDRLDIALDRIAVLERENARLRAAAERDFLTALLNRAAMERRIAAAIPAGCAVAFIDIDRFKAINDGLGHAAGDHVLRAFADALRQGFGDHPLARWGGEEFMVLLPAMNLSEAVARVDGVRARIAGMAIPGFAEGRLPTFSAGVAVSDNGGIDALVQAADRCLYIAKDGGRNRVVSESCLEDCV